MSALLTLGNVTIDRGAYLVWIDERPVDVTYVEFEILSLLARNLQKVVSRERLHRAIWPDENETEGEARKLTVHISRLRKKLAGSTPYAIRTIPRRGYSLTDVVPASIEVDP